MRPRGFTLIEMVVTVAIVGLLATAAFPLVQLSTQRAKESELRQALREIRTAIDAYKVAADTGRVQKEVDASGYPPSLHALVEGVEDQRSPNQAKIYFLRRLPRDPFFPDGEATAEQTWGIRSYASPPEAPEAGRDVFDVYSLSSQKSINGVAYRDW